MSSFFSLRLQEAYRLHRRSQLIRADYQLIVHHCERKGGVREGKGHTTLNVSTKPNLSVLSSINYMSALEGSERESLPSSGASLYPLFISLPARE